MRPGDAPAASARESGRFVRTHETEGPTGLKSPGDWHNTGLVVTLEDQRHLTQDWTFLYNGKTGRNSFHFTRER